MGSRRSEITDHPTETHKWTITEIEFLSNLFNQNLSIEFIEQLKNSFLREGKCPFSGIIKIEPNLFKLG